MIVKGTKPYSTSLKKKPRNIARLFFQGDIGMTNKPIRHLKIIFDARFPTRGEITQER